MNKFMPKLIHPSSKQPGTVPWLILMFLFACNVMSAGGYLLLILMAAYLGLHLREFSFRATEIFLFIFGAEYFLIYILWFNNASFGDLCNNLVAPWLVYWIGRNMALRSKQDDLPLKVGSVLTLGFFTYGLLSMAYSMYFSPPGAGARVMYKFWDHTELSVTGGGFLFSLAIGASIGHLTTKNPLRDRLFWIAVLGGCLYFAFTWAHRTSVYIIAILIAYNYAAFLLRMNASPVRKIALLFGTVLLVSAAVICLALDVGGCRSWLQGQWLYQRLTDAEAANSGSRFTIWDNFFDQWLLYPMGGRQFRIYASYVHNMWLDVYYMCGVLPFIALVAATVMIAWNVFHYRKIQTEPQGIRSAHILTNCYLAIFLTFMLEPVISSNPYIFLAVLLISGCIDGAIMKDARN